MCVIKETATLGGHTFLFCTPHAGNYDNAKTLKITDKDNNIFTTNEFDMEKTKSCFGDNPVAPVIKLLCDAPTDFLKVGNEISLQH